MRKTVLVAAMAAIVLGALISAAAQDPTATAVPTYTKDVAPILFKNCTTCHRPGEIAPMSLLTYDDVRPHAHDIKDEIGLGHMPPWHADAPAGTFENERRLTDAEKKVIFDWVDGGGPKGNHADMPPQPKYTDGWQIGTPDAIFAMQEAFKVPAEG